VLVFRSVKPEHNDLRQGRGALPAPRCPKCCRHGLPFSAEDQKLYGTSGWCGWCEDVRDGYDDGPYIDEPQWLCPHGIGEDPSSR
jgi:hypothetical protein